MIKTCLISHEKFEITDQDMTFYNKINVPSPTLSPSERRKRRLSFRNERNLKHGTCDKCGEKIITMFDQSKNNIVYCRNCWWGDNWDAINLNTNFTQGASFFTQFNQILSQTPKFNLQNAYQENCKYSNFDTDNKNSYLCFSNAYCEDSLYSEICGNCNNIIDSTFSSQCELSYQLIDCRHCFELFWGQNCSQCHNSYFLANCHNCKNCFGCINLHHSEFCIFNKQYSQKDYEEFISDFNSQNHKIVAQMYQQFLDFFKKQIHRANENHFTENCQGEYLMESKDCHNSFDSINCENCHYCYLTFSSKDNYDCDLTITSTSCYECIDGENGFDNIFCYWFRNCKNIAYCFFMINCEHCFGCSSLKNKKYCILNKQYTENEYFSLKEKIISQMKKDNEWGEFFPSKVSPCAYKDSLSYEYFTPYNQIENHQNSNQISQNIHQCSCGQKYKIITQEQEFYQKYKLPIPHKCPKCRYLKRLSLRRPNRLINRTCPNCQKEIQTTLPIKTFPQVYCVECYRKTIN